MANDKLVDVLVYTLTSELIFAEKINATLDLLKATNFNAIENVNLKKLIAKGIQFLTATECLPSIQFSNFDNKDNLLEAIKDLFNQENKDFCLILYIHYDSMSISLEYNNLLRAIEGLFLMTAGKKAKIRYQIVNYTHYLQKYFTDINAVKTGVIRKLSGDISQLSAEVAADVFDLLQDYLNSATENTLSTQNLLSAIIYQFLTRTVASDWILFYFTGSVVSSFIYDLENKAIQQEVKVIKGPNEHSLACGAVANWLLFKRPFVIVVTHGMLSELKGTLANLRQCRAKGFIICAESKVDSWFTLQGTINADEDIREVLSAQRIPWLYLDNPNALLDQVENIAKLYHADNGPVVLLVTPNVLSYGLGFDIPIKTLDNIDVPNTTYPSLNEEVLQQIVNLINHDKASILWQCGDLNRREFKKVLEIAETAGIALTDSCDKPGTIPHYRNKEKIMPYLGILSAYGTNQQVYNYLYSNKQPNPQSEQCLFFLKQKISQIQTPFPEYSLKNYFRIYQVNKNASHISPYTDIPIVAELEHFLDYIRNRLQVDDEVFKYRKQKILTAQQSYKNNQDFPSIPLTPSHFCLALNAIIEPLISDGSYEYIGLYDAGRFGISAIHNIVRTSQGFGTYGRGLMGDALLATHTLAFTAQKNLLAFIGDGAKNLVPDIVPSLIENILYGNSSIIHNITIFYGINHRLSLINTYHEKVLGIKNNRQVILFNQPLPDHEFFVKDVRFSFKTLYDFDKKYLEEALFDKPRINFISVILSDPHYGDGLPSHSLSDWRMIT